MNAVPNPVICLLLLAALPALAAGPSARPSARDRHQKTPQPQVIGYFTEGGARSGKYTVKDIATSGAAARLTEINYAFGRVADNQCQIADRETALNHSYSPAESVDGTADPAGDNQLRGTFHQLQELKRRYPALKAVISFGGWASQTDFPAPSSRSISRSSFADVSKPLFEDGLRRALKLRASLMGSISTGNIRWRVA